MWNKGLMKQDIINDFTLMKQLTIIFFSLLKQEDEQNMLFLPQDKANYGWILSNDWSRTMGEAYARESPTKDDQRDCRSGPAKWKTRNANAIRDDRSFSYAACATMNDEIVDNAWTTEDEGFSRYPNDLDHRLRDQAKHDIEWVFLHQQTKHQRYRHDC